MVYKPSVYLASAAVALVALQMHQVAASSLKFDPFTTCTSYNIGDESFPGRGSEIIDDGNCVVTVPEDPNVPKVAALSIVSVLDTSLLSKSATAPSESVFTKVGTQVMSEKIPPTGADQDAYVETDQATSALPASASTTSTTTSRKLEWNSEDDIATLEKYFGTSMELKLKNLPTQAVYKPSAWAGPN
ncbi:hypothetical protein PF005_g24709 [Phytophthora fragariae]|uniref:RxLR effector protein n=1 Tax=Phytophthora fragariae TaxID=53985 RepID=A0A6A3I832_9STRA|nr:hypothetical protein PF003_g35330 [Phytophthora fragariae]KAE8924289.1 hypothetical protein PF009_g25479 [Phytophthora fragariae]KAE8977967.1 hypothetical protein PF011_g23440 [Phytophthora fragariae]KAE9075468.1 hypothetical protein PF010_g24293 [Phytophthora fragariae]KAE9076292.1 hypothetical protein PF007_g24681 [Phytophthora fragariae]